MNRSSSPAGLVLGALLSIGSLTVSGCGVLTQPLPAATRNFTLTALAEIQSDERLTDDQRRDRIRELVGAPDSDEGDRLVEFLLTFNVP